METAEHCPTPILGSEEGKREKLKTDLLTQKSLPATVGYTFPPLPPWIFQASGECVTAWVTSSSSDWLTEEGNPFSSFAWRPVLGADSTSGALYWSFATRMETARLARAQILHGVKGAWRSPLRATPERERDFFTSWRVSTGNQREWEQRTSQAFGQGSCKEFSKGPAMLNLC